MEAPSYPSVAREFIELQIELDVHGVDEVVASFRAPGVEGRAILGPIAELPQPTEVDATAGLAILRGYATEPGGLLRDVGRRLFRFLLAGSLRRPYSEVCDLSARTGRPVALRIGADDVRLAAQPWELLFDDGARRTNEYLVLSGWPVARMDRSAPPAPDPGSVKVLRVLALIAGLPLPVERDLAVLREIADATGALAFEEYRIASAEEAVRVIAKSDAHVVHYAGAGIREYLNTDGVLGPPALRATSESTLRMRDLRFALGRPSGPRLVVLNAELSDRVAADLAPLVPAVIGFRGRVYGGACLAFAQGLYQAIAAGASVRGAVVAGRQQIQYRYPQDGSWSLPVHWDRGDTTLLGISPGDEIADEAEHPEEVAILLEERSLAMRNLDAVRQRRRLPAQVPLPSLATQEERLADRVAELDRQLGKSEQ